MDLKDAIDISDEIELKNGRGNPFGWSQEEIWHDGKAIGWLECGKICIYNDDYYSEEVQESPKQKRGIIYFKV